MISNFIEDVENNLHHFTSFRHDESDAEIMALMAVSLKVRFCSK